MQHFPLTEKLHTDILAEKYGPIHVQTLKQNSVLREALLIDSKGITRTYALTFFENWKDKEVSKISEEIKKGKPIGGTFRTHGYSIRKNVLDVFVIKLPSWLKTKFKTKENFSKA